MTLRTSRAIAAVLLILLSNAGAPRLAAQSVPSASVAPHLTRLVDPFIGTGGHGHTFPGAVLPFGMVQLSPDAGKSGWDWCSGYHASDTALAGFSHTHLSGTGCADLGDVLLRPAVTARAAARDWRMPFSHADEIAAPGFYSVLLHGGSERGGDVLAELTTTRRAGMHRYHFPVADSAFLVLDLAYGQDDRSTHTALRVVSPQLVTGERYSRGWARNQKVFFAMRLSAPFHRITVHDGARTLPGEGTYAGEGLVALFDMQEAARRSLVVKVGLSAVSAEGALANLDAEMPGWDIAAVRATAEAAWEKALGTFRVASTDTAALRTFYTAVYHAMLVPMTYCDVDGRYRGGDDRVHDNPGFETATVFSLWDTYRALHPLFSIVDRTRSAAWARSLLAFQEETGLLPVWTLHANETNCMIGYHSVPVLVDAVLKGLPGVDARRTLAAVKASALRPNPGLDAFDAERVTPVHARAPQSPALPAFGLQAWGSTGPILGGYRAAVAGDTIEYHSSHPAAHTALIARANRDQQRIAWTTDTVPTSFRGRTASFTWIAGVATGRGGKRFDLEVDGRPVLHFSTPENDSTTSFVCTGADGAMLRFHGTLTDEFHDLFGNMTLTLPAKYLQPGAPLTLALRGEDAGSHLWVMTFAQQLQAGMRVAPAAGLGISGTDTCQFARVFIERVGPPAPMTLDGGVGTPLHALVYPGLNSFDVPVPRVRTPREIGVEVRIVGGAARTLRCVLPPEQMLGYVPAEVESQAVSKTLEYAFDDACIAQLAALLGESDDERRFSHRAQNYRNLFDPGLGFMRGRAGDGSWRVPFDPRFSTLRQHEYTEGNAWQYSWYVPHDVPGLIALHGGREGFARKLDSLFTQPSDLEGTGATADLTGLIGLYAQGNEPSHHIAYLFNHAGRPWRTQELVRRVMTGFYTDARDGLCGNEDCGQMSAWYILSSLGFYPVNPCGGDYDLGVPLFPRAEIALENGRTFTVSTENFSPEHPYVQRVLLDGAPLSAPVLRYDDIMRGATLTFVMGPSPANPWEH
jgi:putative alpha-1,2-mannosidase